MTLSGIQPFLLVIPDFNFAVLGVNSIWPLQMVVAWTTLFKAGTEICEPGAAVTAIGHPNCLKQAEKLLTQDQMDEIAICWTSTASGGKTIVLGETVSQSLCAGRIFDLKPGHVLRRIG